MIPVIAISFLSSSVLGKKLGEPSETDKFMQKKGGNADLDDARKRKEFWLVFFSFSIMIGISRMMDDNASLIALSNSTTASSF